MDMSACLPDLTKDEGLAAADNISMNQFIALAVSEKVAALRTVEYLKERGQRGDQEKFVRVLDKIAQAGHSPLEEDRLPPVDGSRLRQVLNRERGETPQPGDELP
jgi:hypothetical protein